LRTAVPGIRNACGNQVPCNEPGLLHRRHVEDPPESLDQLRTPIRVHAAISRPDRESGQLPNAVCGYESECSRHEPSPNSRAPGNIDLTWNAPFRGLGGTTVLIPQPYGLANVYNRRTPYSIQYLLNVQRELGGDTALEIGYLGSVSRRLESLRAFNEAYPTADTTLPVALRSPYPELGRFQEVDGSGKANYNALSAKLQRRFSKGLTYMFGYTWSKSIDYGSAIRVHDTDVLFPQSSYNLHAERGLSSFNQDHRAVTSVLYDLPVGKGRRFLGGGGIVDAIIGRWQLGSIFTVQSGFPATVIDN